MNNFSHFINDNGTAGKTWECNFVATVYFTVSIIFIMFYIPCTYLIVTDKSIINLPYYRILVYMGVLDLLTLILNGLYSSLLTYIRRDSSSDYTFFVVNKFVGGFMNSVNITYNMCAHLLAFNRFVTTCFPIKSQTIFSLKNTHVILILCSMHNLVMFVGYLIPGLNFVYSIKTFSWDYDSNGISSKASEMECTYDTFHAIGMILWYIAVIAVLKFQSKRTSQLQSNRRRNREIKVLLQAMIVCSLVIVNEGLFFIVANDPQAKWSRFISNMVWLTCAGSNALVYLGFNRDYIKLTVTRNFAHKRIMGDLVFRVECVRQHVPWCARREQFYWKLN